MKLELLTNQKYLIEILAGKEQYIIPAYQRAYSWEEEQCRQLFEDLEYAFKTDPEEGYFLGSIVVSQNSKNVQEVIDGQQRLITLTLLIKTLLTLDKENDDLKDAINIKNPRDKKDIKARLRTYVFEKDDPSFLEKIISSKNIEFCKSKEKNHFQENICFFKNKLEEFSKSNTIEDFSEFIMENVSLLVIESKDPDSQKARYKALKIFETINHRGLELSSSDIFKATLYSLAINEDKDKSFISRWTNLDKESALLGYTINDIFRIYTHIIRGEKKISNPKEVGLMEFFTQKKHFSFEIQNYEKVLGDLEKIMSNIQYYENTIKNPNGSSNELTKWFQLLKQYSNQYPKMAFFVYLFKYNSSDDSSDSIVLFTKKLLRYVYCEGSSAPKVRSTIFTLITEIMNDTYNNNSFIYPCKNNSGFNNLGKLKNSFALLAFYLNPKQKAIYPYYFDKIFYPRDIRGLNNYNDCIDSIGNILVVDFPKKNTLLSKKIPYFKKSNIEELKSLSEKFTHWTKKDCTQREIDLKKRLTEFLND